MCYRHKQFRTYTVKGAAHAASNRGPRPRQVLRRAERPRRTRLHVAPGEVFALLGPNGAGKTTTINILTTLVRPDAGRATVAGFDVVRDAESVTPADQPHRPVGRRRRRAHRRREPRDARAAVRARARPRRRRVRRSCSSASTSTDAARQRVGAYSGGMRRRLDLALSFVVTPAVLFLDEPTTGLDTRSRRELWDVIRTLADAGTTVFLTTQYLEEADRLADRIAVLDGGRIVATGTPDELKARLGGETVELRDARRRAAARGADRRHRVGPAARARRARRVGRRGNVDAAAPEPRRRVPRPHRHPRPRPPRPSRSSDDHRDPSRPRRDHRHPSPHHRPDRRVGVREAQPAALASRRRIALDGDHAAGDAHAAVHVRVRRRDRSDRRLRRLRRARHHPAVRRVRRRLHRGVRRTRHADRHHRPLPHDAAAQRRGAHRACRSRAWCATCSRPAS